ncbi:MAG TPA: glycosyltransferase family 39 protein [bacterium]|nr:glycosyltransferase family 39 protein [bacterium]
MPFPHPVRLRHEPAVSLAACRRLFFVVWLFTLAFRLYGVTNPLYDMNAWRQTETAAITRNYYEDRLPFWEPEIDWCGPRGQAEMEFPFYSYLVAALYRGFGPNEVWGRLVTILCSGGVAWALWDIGRQLGHPLAGVFAAALFAAAPLSIYYGRTFQPDMMMVFLSTSSLAFLLRWERDNQDRWLPASGATLALGVLLKPPCLLMALPLGWVFYRRYGTRLAASLPVWLYAAGVLIPMVIWYSHAHTFFLKSGATFMWHFKGFSWRENLLAVYLNPGFWRRLIFTRFGFDILIYAGWIPFLTGLWRVGFHFPNRILVWAWLAGIALYYLIIPGHHYGHDYYTLLAIPVFALVGGIGLEWMASATRESIGKRTCPALGWSWPFVIPAGMAAASLGYLISTGWYDKQYLFYDDALHLQRVIPQGALIAVADEVPHTPEFFYFVNRNGWHFMRDSRDGVDDSAWLEDQRAKGARYYVGLNESAGNHPIRYLQTHPLGQYILDHYAIAEIGYRYFVARLGEPVYGDHLVFQYAKKSVATNLAPGSVPWSQIRSFLPLDRWREAEVLLFDFHQANPDARESWNTIYAQAVEKGFRITHQESGRVVMESSPRLDPLPGFLSLVRSTRELPQTLKEDRVALGWLPAGRHRVSVALPPDDDSTPIELRVENDLGTVLASRILSATHLAHVPEGERPDLHFSLAGDTAVSARVLRNGQTMRPDSVVWMPDVRCVPLDAVIQAEQLHHVRAEIWTDPHADRKSALRGKTQDIPEFIVFGLYFQFPSAWYDVTFSLRKLDPQAQGKVELILVSDSSRRLADKVLPLDEIPTTYANYTLSGALGDNAAADLIACLHPRAELMADTIRITQRKRAVAAGPVIDGCFLLPRDGEFATVNTAGVIRNGTGTILDAVWLENTPLAGAVWTRSMGVLFLDEAGRIWNRSGKLLWTVPLESGDRPLLFDVSPDGQRIGVVSQSRQLFLLESGAVKTHALPESPFPLRGLVVDKRDTVVLYGDGAVWSTPASWKPKETLDFKQDALRALIKHPQGWYAVDFSGAVHSFDGAPAVSSPYYRPDPWVRDARRTADGHWALLSREGQVLIFQE